MATSDESLPASNVEELWSLMSWSATSEACDTHILLLDVFPLSSEPLEAPASLPDLIHLCRSGLHTNL